jgi:translation initiation factor 2 alpha subunit (eIF-2alpha)
MTTTEEEHTTVFFYEEQEPAVHDIVIADVLTIGEHAIYCTLPAYRKLRVMLPTSEIFVKRGRRVADYVQEGKRIAVQVIRKEQTKNGVSIDVSLKHIHEEEKTEAFNTFHKDQKILLLVRTAAELDIKKMEELYRDFIWKIPLTYKVCEEIRVSASPRSLYPDIPESLLDAILRKIPLPSHSVSKEIRIQFDMYHDGVLRLTSELTRLSKIDNIQVFITSPPIYTIIATDSTKERAQARLDEVCATISEKVLR